MVPILAFASSYFSEKDVNHVCFVALWVTGLLECVATGTLCLGTARLQPQLLFH